MADFPPAIDPQITQCVAAAADYYNVDPRATVDRIMKRLGMSGRIREVDGILELGIAGVPADRVKDLGLSAKAVKDDDCLNVSVGILLQAKAAQTAWSGPGGVPATAAAAVLEGRGRALPRLGPQAERCASAAAAAYELPEPVFRAVLRTEGGWVGLKKANTNGTFDMGPGQINTIHLAELSKYGITEEMLVNDACINIYVAAYRLRSEVHRVQNLWKGVGNYHSRTPHLHQAYLTRVLKNL